MNSYNSAQPSSLSTTTTSGDGKSSRLTPSDQERIIAQLIDQRTLMLYPLHKYVQVAAPHTQRAVPPKPSATVKGGVARMAAEPTNRQSNGTTGTGVSHTSLVVAPAVAASAPVDGNAIAVSRSEKERVLRDLLTRDPALFLERYAALLTDEQLDLFQSAYPAEYEVTYHVQLQRTRRHPQALRDAATPTDQTHAPAANSNANSNPVPVSSGVILAAAGTGDAAAYAAALAAAAASSAASSAVQVSPPIAEFREPPNPPPWRRPDQSTARAAPESTASNTASAADYLDFPLDALDTAPTARRSEEAGMSDDEDSSRTGRHSQSQASSQSAVRDRAQLHERMTSAVQNRVASGVSERHPIAVAGALRRTQQHATHFALAQSQPQRVMATRTADPTEQLSVAQRNRRFAMLQRLEATSDYFSEAAMREREPVLYEQYRLHHSAIQPVAPSSSAAAAAVAPASAASAAALAADEAMSDQTAVDHIQQLTRQFVTAQQTGMANHLSRLTLETRAGANASGVRTGSDSKAGGTGAAPAPAAAKQCAGSAAKFGLVPARLDIGTPSAAAAAAGRASAPAASSVAQQSQASDSSADTHPLSHLLLRNFDYKQKLAAQQQTTLSAAPVSNSRTAEASGSGSSSSSGDSRPPAFPDRASLIAMARTDPNQRDRKKRLPPQPRVPQPAAPPPAANPAVSVGTSAAGDDESDDTPLFRRRPAAAVTKASAKPALAQAFAGLSSKVNARSSGVITGSKALAGPSPGAATAGAAPQPTASTASAQVSTRAQSTPLNAAILRRIAEQKRQSKSPAVISAAAPAATRPAAAACVPASERSAATQPMRTGIRARKPEPAAASSSDLVASDESELDDSDSDTESMTRASRPAVATSVPATGSTGRAASRPPQTGPAHQRMADSEDESDDGTAPEAMAEPATERVASDADHHTAESDEPESGAAGDGDREQRLAEFTAVMKQRFVAGLDTAQIDYASIDADEALDDVRAQERDFSDAYFDTD